MELSRAKNVATYVTFPLKKNDGTLLVGAAGLDSEIDAWADGAAPNGFADCTNEATEIGSTGIYYLSLSQTEMNNDYIVLLIKSSSTGAIPQVILINTKARPIGEVTLAASQGSYAPAKAGDAMTLTAAYDAAKSAASQTSVNTIDGIVDNLHDTDLPAVKTETAAIKAKTDNLPADPADESALEAAITAAHGTTDGKVDAMALVVANIHDTDLPAVKTETAAIKAKTDNLPASPANEATLTTLHGHIDDILGDTAELQAELADGGRTDLLIDGVKAKTDNLPADPADESAIEAAITAAHGTTDGKVDAMALVVADIHDTDLPAVKTETAAIKAKTDNLPASPANEATLTTLHGHIDDILGDTAELQAELADGGRTDLLIDGVKAKTDNLPADPADESAIEAAITAAHSITDTKLNTIDGILDDLHDTHLPAIKTETAAIKAKTDNLPASPAAVGSAMTLSAAYDAAKSAASQASVDVVDGILDDIHGVDLPAVKTETAAIKAKTDNLPADPADESAIEAAITAAHATTDGKIDTVDGIVDTIASAVADIHNTDLPAVKTETSAIKVVTDNVAGMYETDGAVKRLTANALELAPTGAGEGATDWTVGEKEQIRDALGVTGDKSAATGGQLQALDTVADAIKAKTDNLPADPADESAIEAAITAAHATTDGKIDTVDGIADTIASAVADIHDTDLPAVKTETAAIKVVTDNVAGMYETDGAVKRLTANALEQAPTGGGEGTSDWTVGEKEQIRSALGVDGDKTAATGGQLQTLDTVADAIKAKTDNLPADPADESALEAAITAAHGATDGKVDAMALVVANIHDTDLPAVKTETAAIKAKTDNLPTDPADESAIEAAITAAHATTDGKLDTVDGIVDSIKLETAAIQAKTDNLPADPADESALEAAIEAAHATTDGKINTVNNLLDNLHDTDLPAVKTETAAIKAKTDNLPASPANEATLTTLHGHIDDILGDTAELQAELADGGRTDLLIDGVKAKTDNLPADPADESAIEAAITAAHATTNGKVDVVDGILDDLHGTDIPAIKTETAAIKAKTDNLPANPAAVGSAMTLSAAYDAAKTAAPTASEVDAELSSVHGAGAWGGALPGSVTYPAIADPLVDPDGDPLAGARVEAYSDADRETLIQVATTDTNGIFELHLLPGTYYFRAIMPGYDNSEWSEVVE